MKARLTTNDLRRELHDFLIADQISLESKIVNNLVWKMIDIELNEKDLEEYGFNLSNYYYHKDENSIKFSLPSLSLKQLEKVLDFFGIPPEEYKTNSSIILHESNVFNRFLPLFKEFYISARETNPALITAYRVKSRGILESSAISTLEEYTGKAVNTIMQSENPDMALVDAIVLLAGKVRYLSNQPIFYKSIINTAPSMQAYLQTMTDQKLKKELQLIVEGIDLFSKYHRKESVIAIKNYLHEIDLFLNKQAISSKECDIVEHALLHLAGAKLGAKGECSHDSGSESSRMVFKFKDMTVEDAKKVVNYLQQLGDETAAEGKGYRQYGSTLPQSGRMESVIESCRKYTSSNSEKLESHSVEMDGKFLHQTLLPLLVHSIKNLSANELEPYKLESRKWFEKNAAKNITVSDKLDSLFNNQSANFISDLGMDLEDDVPPGIFHIGS